MIVMFDRSLLSAALGPSVKRKRKMKYLVVLIAER